MTLDDRVVRVANLDPDLPPTVRELLELPDGLTRLASLAPAAGSRRPIGTVELAPVVPDPRAIWCAALT
jgi:hypothetical protein